MSEESRSSLTENFEIVASLKSNAIINIVRVYSQRTIDRIVSADPFRNTKDIFDLLPGTVLLYLEGGDIIGFDFDDVKDSVVAWFDTHNGVMDYTNYYDREWASYMSYDDPTYSDKGKWEHMINKKIIKIKVLKIDRGGKAYFNDSKHRAIILENDTGDMVLSYCLRLPQGGPFVLTQKCDFPQELMDVAEVFEL